MRSTSTLFTALLLATVIPAHAGERLTDSANPNLFVLARSTPDEHAWHLGIGGGMSLPVTDAKTTLENGFNGEVYVGWAPPGQPFGLRATVNADRHPLRGLSSGETGTGTLLGGLAGITIGVPSGPVRPYVTVGCGTFTIVTETNGTTNHATKLGVDAGVGLQLKLGGTGLFVEGRLQNLFNPPRAEYGTTKTLAEMESQIVPVTFGLHW